MQCTLDRLKQRHEARVRTDTKRHPHNDVKWFREALNKEVRAASRNAGRCPFVEQPERVLGDVYDSDIMSALGQRYREPSTATTHVKNAQPLSRDVSE